MVVYITMICGGMPLLSVYAFAKIPSSTSKVSHLMFQPPHEWLIDNYAFLRGCIGGARAKSEAKREGTLAVSGEADAAAKRGALSASKMKNMLQGLMRALKVLITLTPTNGFGDTRRTLGHPKPPRRIPR